MLMRSGAFLIERCPILKYVPGYTTELEEWRREESQVSHDQLNHVSRELETGKAGPSFARYLLENQSSQTFERRNGLSRWIALWRRFRHDSFRMLSRGAGESSRAAGYYRWS
ncbi:hypothetical protein EDB19DRAFT_2038085 [Suillus lakei]|nr:hypothetical protein EDB19DRAFT_2038085 [Suillus lakei]